MTCILKPLWTENQKVLSGEGEETHFKSVLPTQIKPVVHIYLWELFFMNSYIQIVCGKYKGRESKCFPSI